MLDKKKVVEEAKKEVGYHEKKSDKDLNEKKANSGNKNYTKYAEFFDDLRKQKVYVFNYEKNPTEWCAIFVIYCFAMAYGVETMMKMLYLPSKSSAAGCKFFAQYFRDKKAFKSSPDVGDVIFFGKKGSESHVGLVSKVTEKMVYTIEGNKSNEVKECSYRLTNTNIAGYGRPNWEVEEAEKPKADPKPVEKPKENKPEPVKNTVKIIKASNSAKFKSENFNKTYTVNAVHGLNLRDGAGKAYKLMTTMPFKTSVRCYGYYTRSAGEDWLLVSYKKGKTEYQGFCCKKYLK